ncbi:MAG: polyamine aminopropyltransferase [Cyclobacteriaceae bacterium]|nr:polyamine aminopropyltransferase [Cyclobacteriaceae bacterium HetDA_MAG_MS6]
MKYTSSLLKVALFATGLAGIVAEYTLSTLATYFLGDSVFQWTMIVSIMLFSMGLGSRLSKQFENNLLERFVWLEFALSCITANVTIIVYTFFAIYGDTTFIIYLLSVLVGLMIGMEIPLVIRLNERFQSLKVNISSALENDYYGSLAGGVFFAFIGLPYLGLTYTPLILGCVNFMVAGTFLMIIWGEVVPASRKKLVGLAMLVLLILMSSGIFSDTIIKWGDRVRYKDRIVYSEQTRYQKIVLTYGDGDYWLFLNGHQQLSTFDEALYHEPLVHTPMLLHGGAENILVLGGGDGAAVREILKYDQVKKITLVDLDPGVTKLAMTHPVLLGINQNALNHPKVQVINQDGFTYLEQAAELFDVIIADFPDPRTVDLGRLYSLEFYYLCYLAMEEDGLLITQAGSPYYAEQAFECIQRTMRAAGFKTLPLHNQVLTLGEWGWVLGAKNQDQDLKHTLRSRSLGAIETQWLTNDALTLLSAFGQEVFAQDYKEPEVNRLHDPVLYRYYLDGRWDVY